MARCMASLELIVPSPMSAVEGVTKDGSPSPHAQQHRPAPVSRCRIRHRHHRRTRRALASPCHVRRWFARYIQAANRSTAGFTAPVSRTKGLRRSCDTPWSRRRPGDVDAFAVCPRAGRRARQRQTADSFLFQSATRQTMNALADTWGRETALAPIATDKLTTETARTEFEFATLLASDCRQSKPLAMRGTSFAVARGVRLNPRQFQAQACVLPELIADRPHTAAILPDHTKPPRQVTLNVFKGFYSYDSDGAVLIQTGRWRLRLGR